MPAVAVLEHQLPVSRRAADGVGFADELARVFRAARVGLDASAVQHCVRVLEEGRPREDVVPVDLRALELALDVDEEERGPVVEAAQVIYRFFVYLYHIFMCVATAASSFCANSFWSRSRWSSSISYSSSAPFIDADHTRSL